MSKDNETKELSEMSLEELWELFPIKLVEPRADEWEKSYLEEEKRLIEIAGKYIQRISHVGSTAVGSIKAKPIVDIVVEVKDGKLRECASCLAENGYIIMNSEEHRISLNKGYTKYGYAEEVFHIHLRKEGDADERYFCRYLKNNPDVAKEYESLKMRLLEKYGRNRDAYTEAKTDFVKKITSEAKSLYRK